ncbi:hypothetical protein [Mesobacillus maritimus]
MPKGAMLTYRNALYKTQWSLKFENSIIRPYCLRSCQFAISLECLE